MVPPSDLGPQILYPLSMVPGVVNQKSTPIKSERAMSTSRRNQALTGNPKGLIWNAEIVQTCGCVGWPPFFRLPSSIVLLTKEDPRK